VIAPTFNAEKLITYAEVTKEVAKGNTELIVTGGGKPLATTLRSPVQWGQMSPSATSLAYHFYTELT